LKTDIRILEKYYFTVLFKFFLIALLVLATIFLFFQLLEEIPKIGMENYSLKSALVYLFFLSPSVIYSIGFFAILIGFIIGLASLINSREIHIFLASGISIKEIIFKGIKFAFILSIFTFIFGELIATSSSFYAKKYKSLAMNSGEVIKESKNFWVKKDNHFIFIGNNINGNSFEDIEIISIEEGAISQLLNSKKGEIIEGELVLKKVNIDYLENITNVSKIEKSYKENYNSEIKFKDKTINLIEIDPAMMRTDEIISQILILNNYNLDHSKYLLEIGNRVFRPFSLIALLLIAMSLNFNLNRNVSLGSKIFTGVMLGVVSHFITKIIMISVLKIELNFLLAFFIPLALLYFFGFYFLSKISH